MFEKLANSSTLWMGLIAIAIISLNHKLNLQLDATEISLILGITGVYTAKQGAVQVLGDKNIAPKI